MRSETGGLLDQDAIQYSINETPKERCGAYIRCMLFERLRKRLSAGTGLIDDS